jgi:hypothetical protein
MTLTAAGPRCDICGDYMLLDKSMNAFSVPGCNNELHCHDRCRPLVEGKHGRGMYDGLPDGPLKQLFDYARSIGKLEETG